jgi:AcrR family transcriptional regulator
MESESGRSGRPARASVWLGGKARRGGTSRSGQPSGLDRARITGVTVRLLDEEGLAKFSMRRLAAELDVTAMSVYWYVDTKDDLLELALDQVHGELRLPGEEPEGDWRDTLRALMGEYRALLLRHPWLSALAGTFLNVGPHALAFSGAVQRVIRRTGLPAHGQMGAISAVSQFAYGFGTMESHFAARSAAAGMTQDEYFRHAMSSVRSSPEVAGDEAIEAGVGIMRARGGDTVEEMRERDFAFALDLLVAGIETMAARTGEPGTGG